MQNDLQVLRVQLLGLAIVNRHTGTYRWVLNEPSGRIVSVGTIQSTSARQWMCEVTVNISRLSPTFWAWSTQAWFKGSSKEVAIIEYFPIAWRVLVFMMRCVRNALLPLPRILEEEILDPILTLHAHFLKIYGGLSFQNLQASKGEMMFNWSGLDVATFRLLLFGGFRALWMPTASRTKVLFW